jgi:hypothetical protein
MGDGLGLFKLGFAFLQIARSSFAVLRSSNLQVPGQSSNTMNFTVTSRAFARYDTPLKIG